MFKVVLTVFMIALMGLSAQAGTERSGRPQPAPVPRPMPPTPRPIPVPETKMLRESISPFQQWSPLGAQAHGLLLNDKIQGISLIDAQSLRETYRYVSNNDDTPVTVYFPSKGDGFNFMKDWEPPAGNGYKADVAEYGPGYPNSWGLNQDAHIVDVEVNGGKGSGGAIHFVASDTHLSVVDAYIQPSVVINNFLQPYADEKGAAQLQVLAGLDNVMADKKLNDQAYAAVAQDKSEGQTDRGYMMRLSPDGTQLKMTYYVNRTYTMVKGAVYRGTRCLGCGGNTVPNTGGIKPIPHCMPGVSVTTYGVEFARTVTMFFWGNSVQKQIDEQIQVRPYIGAEQFRQGPCYPIDPLPICKKGEHCPPVQRG